MNVEKAATLFLVFIAIFFSACLVVNVLGFAKEGEPFEQRDAFTLLLVVFIICWSCVLLFHGGGK